MPEGEHAHPHSVLELSAQLNESYQAVYQQALVDFAIVPLIQHLETYSERHFDATWVSLTIQEAEAIAANLIHSLTTSLNGDLIAAYLKAIRHPNLDTSPALSGLTLPPPLTDFPANFPDVEMPRFLYGDRLTTVLETLLSGHEYFLNEYSIVDIAHFGWLWCSTHQGFAIDAYPNLKAWFDRVAARPAVQKGVTIPLELPDFTPFRNAA